MHPTSPALSHAHAYVAQTSSLSPFQSLGSFNSLGCLAHCDLSSIPMAPPSLTDLPVEICEAIVPYTLPNGLGSLALTCKTFHKLCEPFHKEYDGWRRRYLFGKFRYLWWPQKGLDEITSSLTFLRQIAIEPRIAHYVVDANLLGDSWYYLVHPSATCPQPALRPLHTHLRDECTWHPINSLRESACIKDASLDWKQYSSRIREEYDTFPYYSQHAAELLLAFLPNLKSLVLPILWRPEKSTSSIIEAIVSKAQRFPSVEQNASLAQVTRVEFIKDMKMYEDPETEMYLDHTTRRPTPFSLCDAVPFLALPHVEYFHGQYCIGVRQESMMLGPGNPYNCYGQALEQVQLTHACIDDATMAAFLRHTPRLKKLKYLHNDMGDDNHIWDLCKFVAAIEREVGRHLEVLQIGLHHKFRGRLVPGKPSLRGFKNLHSLILTKHIMPCNTDNNDFGFSIGDLIPASVSRLWLEWNENTHEQVYKAMFSGLAARKESQLPNLEKLRYVAMSKRSERERFEKTCMELDNEMKKAGVKFKWEWDDSEDEDESDKENEAGGETGDEDETDEDDFDVDYQDLFDTTRGDRYIVE
ncbi:hypothetical protein GGR56DRAFT_71871 [Xylariaceae sp. FL0804]|nr:hypothetical protein GGR56DRAFT_71871 [Xylariaceae sp. FL0804]